jgi:hypothetical protein
MQAYFVVFGVSGVTIASGYRLLRERELVIIGLDVGNAATRECQ